MKLSRVIKPGFFTTIQDLGRFGFQRYGVPVSGAMDTYAFVAANLLLDNKPGDACLEITLLGPELEFLKDTQIAITGADLTITLNEELVAPWRTIPVCKGDIFSFGFPKSGCRAYLAVKGGIKVPPVLGSKSTYVRGEFGGFKGRHLKVDDLIETESSSLLKTGFLLPQEYVPKYDREITVEVVLGPQRDYFTDKGLETLLCGSYVATTESDRMGYRLEGPKAERKSSMEMVSDAIPVGAVQVPREGKPIIVMRDAQTTGGYPKIAVVTTPDVSRLGQVKPNDKIRFCEISIRKAREKLLECMRILSQLKEKFVELEL